MTAVTSTASTTRRPRPAVPPSRHARRRRVKPGRTPGPARRRGWLRGWRWRRHWGWRPRGLSRRSVLASVAGVVALVVLLGWLLWFSPVLSVRTVAVTGTEGTAASTIRDLAAIPEGMPLARIDTDGIEAALTTLPELASVSVYRSWPSTVRIEVVPRVGVAVVDLAGVHWLIDRTGVLFAQVTEPPAGMPALQVEVAGPQDRATRAALDVIAALPASIRNRVSVVAAQSPDSVVVTLIGGRTVIWGSAADSDRKALVLAGLFDRPGRTIDVSSPSAVVIR